MKKILLSMLVILMATGCTFTLNGKTEEEKKNDVVEEKEKTIVCGHWHSSWGHCRLEGKCSEFGKDSDFSPFYAEGIIAIDGCTAYSGRVNCIVLEDENI